MTVPDAPPSEHSITSIEQLEAIYGSPEQRSLDKEIDHVCDHYRAFIEKAPFVALSTVGPEGTDCTPRGDPPGFVRVTDKKTVLLPDRRGNNRIDSLRNIVRNPQVSLLFLIPGIRETLRINGTAAVSIDPALIGSFGMNGKLPRSVLIVTVDRVYFQCSKALARSRLWDPDTRIERSELPSTGTIIAALSEQAFDGEAYDEGYPEHMKATIY